MENSAWKITKNQKHCRPNSWIQHDSGEIVLHLHWSDCKTWWCKTFKILLAFFFVWWQSKDLGKTAINGYYNIMKTGFVFANQKLLHFHLFMWKFFFLLLFSACARVWVCVCSFRVPLVLHCTNTPPVKIKQTKFPCTDSFALAFTISIQWFIWITSELIPFVFTWFSC